MNIILILFCWVICGILNYGLLFAYLQKEYPTIAKMDYVEDRRGALIVSLFGPIALIVVTMMDGNKHGFKYK